MYVINKHQRNITDFVGNVYFTYFRVEIGNQNECLVPHKVHYDCLEDLRKWDKTKKKGFKFLLRIMWSQQKKTFQTIGSNSKNMKVIVDPNHPSTDRPVEHRP